MAVAELRAYLGARRLGRVEGTKDEMANLASWACWWNLPVNPTELQVQMEAQKRLKEMLTLRTSSGESIIIPDPIKSNNENWSSDLKQVPPVAYPDVYNYLVVTPGGYCLL